MLKKPTPKPAKPAKPRSGRRGDPISLAPLTRDQALALALRVKPADLKKREEEAGAKKRGKA